MSPAHRPGTSQTPVLLSTVLCVVTLTACPRQARPDEALTPRLTLENATALVPSHVPDREGWALDVLTALGAHRLHPDKEAVCSVLAVIEQESGYKANPPVAGLSKIVRGRLESYAGKLGPLARPALKKLLEGRAKGTKLTFDERLEKARTERDLDLLFRDMLRYYESEFPATYTLLDLGHALSGRGNLEGLNPITTAGSMQVAVQFAVDAAEAEGEEEAWAVRDRLYTRAGGVHFGTLRLLGYPTHYDSPLYRFADFNAGFYAARNAAIQEQLGELVGRKLALDGDLLMYDKKAQPLDEDSKTLTAFLAFREKYAPWISERALRREVRKEKLRAFEETDTYRALRAAWEKKTGKPAPYARMPEVVIRSPKMKQERSTAWFARSVERRYLACLARADD